jgi:hypothetical protein
MLKPETIGGHEFIMKHVVKRRSFVDRMSPPVPPLNSAAVQRCMDGQLKWVIDHGLSPSGMPASQGILNDEEIRQIVHYVRHPPPLGGLGVPPAYT